MNAPVWLEMAGKGVITFYNEASVSSAKGERAPGRTWSKKVEHVEGAGVK
jgi:hypothetical protein